MTPHLDDGRITELLDGEVPSSELGAIREHLAACAECAARLAAAQADMDEADALITVLDEPEPVATVVPIATARSASRHQWTRRAAWAASLVIAAGAGYLARGPFMPSPPDQPATTAGAIEATRPAENRFSDEDAPGDPAAAAANRQAAVPSVTPPAAPVVRQESARAPSQQDPDELAAGRRVEAEPEAIADAAADVAASRERLAVDRQEPVSAGAPVRALRLPTPPARQADSIAVARRDGAPGSPVTSKQVLVPDTIDFAEAVERLGGSLRLIDGRYPVRIEAVGNQVQVVYPTRYGELRLSQYRAEERVAWQLIAPRAMPADTLAAIRARVND